MRLEWLRPVTDVQGPFASVTLDVSNVDPVTREQRLKSWGSARRSLQGQGAPEDTIAALEEIMTDEHHRSGERTRVVCAAGGRVVLDIGFPGRPQREGASFGPVPRVLDVVRGLDGAHTHAIVRLDREGADVDVVDPSGELVAATEVTGDHDELRKVGVGGSSQGRFQSRADDSWKHNAAQVAKELDQLVRRDGLDVVFVSGEEHMVSLLCEHASGTLAERIVCLDTGGRADGVSAHAASTALEVALARLLADRDAGLAERWGDAKGSGLAIEGWQAITTAMDKGQVAHVLVQSGGPALDGYLSGDGGGASADQDDVPPNRDLDVLLTKLAETSGELSVVGPPFEAREGIAAILRWTEEPTER